MEEQPQLFDVCVFCALSEEASAVIDEFSTYCCVSFAHGLSRSDHYKYRWTTIHNHQGEPLTVVILSLPKPGPIQAAMDLKPLLQEFRPRFVAMTGICAGSKKHVRLGDLIVAETAFHYEEGKIVRTSDGQVVQRRALTMDHPTDQVLQYARGFTDWQQPVTELKQSLLLDTEPSRLHVAAMASGMAVRADSPFEWLQKQYQRNTIALDMEAASFYHALRAFPSVHGLVVKGVCDYADMQKNDTYHDYAARASAIYLLRFLQEYVKEETMPRRDSSDRGEPIDVWNVPYRRNPHFTGRDELLEKLDRQLSRETQNNPTVTRRAALTQPQAIKGLGGIGKTQIAIEYAYRSREQGRYAHILWINAANEEAIMASFVALAALLPGFLARQETDQPKLVGAIKRWLEQHPQRWLLIFDNADDISLIQEFLPSTGNGSILLTTRASAVGSLASSIEVETMSFVEGTHLLLRRSQHVELVSDEEMNEAGNIVVALDHFPLALDQAGAYIDETQCSFIDYLILYQSHRKELLARRGEQNLNYPGSVATTWSLSFQKVEQANPAAAEFLRLCAFLAPDHIPEELFREGAAYWADPLQEAVLDPFTFNQMLQDLLKFSLVKRLAEDHLLSIHRLVQIVQRERMEQKEQSQWAERVVRAVNAAFPRQPQKEIHTWSQCLRYLEQAQACDVLIQQYVLRHSDAADLLGRTATYLEGNALYSLAEPLNQRALHIWEQLFGPEHFEVANALNRLAILYKSWGKFAEGEPLFKQAIRIWEQQSESESAEIASPIYNLAELYRLQGKKGEAEQLYQRALSLSKQLLGQEHLQVAKVLHGLANLYSQQGKFAEAEQLFLQALHIKEQELGREHPEVARALDGLALVYTDQGKFAEAEQLFLQALHIKEQELGREHPEVAYPLNNLGKLYKTQGKLAEAEPLYLRALLIWEHRLGPEHHEVAYPLNNLGNIYEAQGKLAEAEPLYLRALHIWEHHLGPEHLQVAYPLNNLGNLYKAQSKLAEAEPLYLRALHIWEHHLGSEHSLVACTLYNLGELCHEQNKYTEAESLYQQALRVWLRPSRTEHLFVAIALNGLANLYRDQGDSAKALLLYQRVLSIQEQHLQPYHPNHSDTLHDFAVFNEAQGNLNEALPLYQRALTIRRQVYGPQHPKTAETRVRLRAVLIDLDQSEDGAQLDVAQQEPAETEKEQETLPEP